MIINSNTLALLAVRYRGPSGARSRHGEGAGADAEAAALGAEVAHVAAATVDVGVGAVVEVGRVQRAAAVVAVEAALVPDLGAAKSGGG